MNIDSNYLDKYLWGRKTTLLKYRTGYRRYYRKSRRVVTIATRKEQLEVLIKQLPDDHKFVGMIRKDFLWRGI